MKEGLIWRVGNSENINIWRYPWISNGVTRRPYTPRGRNIVIKVPELIDPSTGGWDCQFFFFFEEDVKYILVIPVRSDMDVFLAWHYNKKGVLSAKSGYHALDYNNAREQMNPAR